MPASMMKEEAIRALRWTAQWQACNGSRWGSIKRRNHQVDVLLPYCRFVEGLSEGRQKGDGAESPSTQWRQARKEQSGRAVRPQIVLTSAKDQSGPLYRDPNDK